MPQPQNPKPSTPASKRTRGKVTCRDSTRGRKSTCGRGGGRGSSHSCTRTLSASRQQNYGIVPSPTPRVSKRTRPQIDYLALNDGLEEETPTRSKT